MAALAWSPDARAWYFPEHVAISHDGLVQLRPELRDVLRSAIATARADGLELCEAPDASLEDVTRKAPLETRMVHAPVRVDCVPYAVLGALAGDHASSIAELRTVLTTPKALEIASAVTYEWSRFQDALRRLPNTPLERMSFVHELDVVFYFIDPGYELRAQGTRAHFTRAGQPIDAIVREAATTGNVDDALGQFLAHHLRSLELAARGHATDALLEHAFALHFLQDAFSAGHLVMTAETWAGGNDRARARHDYFDAKGLPVGRAMRVDPCSTTSAEPLEAGLTPCWVTSGDGFLGLSADASDRVHAARAVTKAELELALALDPARVVAAVEGLGEREQVALGDLVDPIPWWTVPAADRSKLRANAARTVRLVRAGAAAVKRLRRGAETGEVTVGSPPRAGLFDAQVLTSAVDPCERREDVDPSFVGDEAEGVPCGATQALALGTPGVSLLRPILVEWPSSQTDPSELHGESNLDHGWAMQLLASAGAGLIVPPHALVDFFAPAVSVSAGLSYRWGTYLPGRLDRPIAELNVGITESLHYDSSGHAGGNPYVTTLDEELRWPILWEILTSYRLPLDLGEGHRAGRVVLVSGVRVHELIAPAPTFLGVELEAASVALSRGYGSHPLYTASPELRLYIGAGEPSAAQPSLSHAWGPMVSLALTGGFASLL